MALGEPEKAVPFFKFALELNPRFRPFTKEKYLGLAYIQSGRYDLAVSALNRALATAPKDDFANLAISAALALDGQAEAAQRALARHLQRDDEGHPDLEALRKSLVWLGPGVERMLSGLQLAGLPKR